MPAPVFDDVAPWPKQKAKPAEAEIGHNQPPLEDRIQMEFREELLTDKPEFLTVYENLISAVPRVAVIDDETLGKAGNMVKKLRAAEAHVDATHKTVKQPYLDSSRACDAEKKRLVGPLSEARAQVQRHMDNFTARREAEQRAERERIAAEQRAAAEAAARAEREREEAEQAAARAAAEAKSEEDRAAAAEKAREAAEKAEKAMAVASHAPAAPSRSEPVRSDEGTSVSGRTVWNSEVTDYTLAFIHVEDHPKVREAIDKAIAQQVKAGKRTLEGVRIWPTTQAIAR